MADAEALRQFCAARCEMSNLKDANAVETRRISRGTAVCKDMIKRRMVAEGLDVVPIQCEDKQMYAHLKPRAGPAPTITADVVLEAVRAMTFDPNTPATTIPEWVERALAARVRPEATAAATDLDKRLLVITRKPPEHFDTSRPPHPLAATTIQEIANSLSDNRKSAKALRAATSERVGELKRTIARTEEAVATHLQQHDPQTNARRLRLVANGAEETVFLRRKQRVRTQRPTLRTVAPVVKRVVAQLVAQSGHDGPPTFHALRWLQSEPTLALLQSRVAQCLEEMGGTKERVEVVLDRI